MSYTKENNHLDKENIKVKKCDALVETLIANIFTLLLKESNFDSFLKILKLICETYSGYENFIEEVIEKITELLELPNSEISIDKKMAYFNLVHDHKRFNLNDERDNYLKSHLHSIILGNNPSMNDLEIYKKHAQEFKIYDETEVENIYRSIMLKGHLGLTEMKTDVSQLKTDVSQFKTDLRDFKQETRQNFEEVNEKLDLVIEDVAGHSERIEVLEGKR